MSASGPACRDVFPPRDGLVPQDYVGAYGMDMCRDSVVPIQTVNSLVSALQCGENGMHAVVIVMDAATRRQAATFMSTIIQPLARRMHRGNAFCTDATDGSALTRRLPIVFALAIVEGLSGDWNGHSRTPPEEAVKTAIETHVHSVDPLPTTNAIYISSGAKDPWRVLSVVDLLMDSAALDTLTAAIRERTADPSVSGMDLTPFMDRERERARRVKGSKPSKPQDLLPVLSPPFLDTIFTRKEVFEAEEDDETDVDLGQDVLGNIQRRVGAQMARAGTWSAEDVAAWAAQALAPHTDAIVFVTTEYTLAPLGALDPVPGLWDLAQLADAVCAAVLGAPSPAADRIMLLPWDYLGLPHLPKVCALDLRVPTRSTSTLSPATATTTKRGYAYGDVAFLLQDLGILSSAAAALPTRPGGAYAHLHKVVQQWLQASVGTDHGVSARAARIMADAVKWGFDETAGWTKPARGLAPPFDIGAAKDVVISDVVAEADDGGKGSVEDVQHMRAALAAMALVDADKPSQDQALLGIAKRVVGFMVSRNLCANPFRYAFLYLVIGGMVFDGALQTMTLVSHSDNDVRVFYHLTHAVVLTKVPTTCVLAPVPDPATGLTPSRNMQAGYIDDVWHYHFGGAAAVSIAQPKVGKQLKWHMYKAPVLDGLHGPSSTSVPIDLGGVSENPGFRAAVEAGTVMVTLPVLKYNMPTPEVVFGPPGSFHPVDSVPVATMLGVTRYGEGGAFKDGTVHTRGTFARFVQLCARGPTLADAFVLVRAPQLIATANAQEEFAAHAELERATAVVAAAKAALATLLGKVGSADPAELKRVMQLTPSEFSNTMIMGTHTLFK